MTRSWRGGSTTAWRKVRSLVLARDQWQCQLRLPGCTSRATHVDHITPLSQGGSDNPANLRASCQPCNLSRGAPEPDPAPTPHTRWTTNTPTPAPTAERSVVLIVGPPGSGKSTLASTLGLRHMEREQYASDNEFTAAVTRAARAPTARLAVVRTCPTHADQEHWRAMLNATRVIVMDTSQDECVRRCRQRARPGWRGEVAAVRRWFDRRGAPSRQYVPAGDPQPRGGTAW